MKKLLRISISKVYVMYLFLITIFVVGTYSSYAYFTVNKEKKNAIKMVTGNLVGELKIDGIVNDRLVVSANTSKSFSIELINKNDRSARFNFYYKGSLKEGIEVGYILNDGYNNIPSESGVNLTANGTLGYYQKYRIKVKNNTSDNIEIPLGYSIGLDYNDLSLPNDCHLLNEMKMNPNEPKLASNMIPVRYDGSNWVKADKNNWYNYDGQEWANAVTIDNNKVLDLSGNNNHGTVMNGVKISNGEADFDGVDDFINCGFENYEFGNQISILVKVKFKTLNHWFSILGSQDSAGIAMEMKQQNQIHFALYSQEKSTYESIDSSKSAVQGEYIVIAATYDGSTMKLYMDGEKVAEKQVEFTIKASPVPIVIGGNPDNNNGLPVSVSSPADIIVSNMLLFHKVLTEEEIEKNYATSINVEKKDGLLFQYDFQQGENMKNNAIIPMDLINTMWVWIPRYSYTIGSVDGTNYYGKKGEFLTSTPTKALPGEIDVEFVDKNTKDRESAKYKVSEGVSGWYTPDAFTFGTEELEGVWVGKFETSNKEGSFTDNENLTPIIKPKITSWRNIRISTLETVSMKMNKANNIYGFALSEVDSHAMKGSEWALVAYLSQSKYGKLGNKSYSGANKEIYMNAYKGYRTGCSYGGPTFPNSSGEQECSHEYDEIEDRGEGTGAAGAGASTTGNIYGIYDMSGGAWEYVMSNFNGYTGKTESLNSGYNGLLANGTQYDKGIPYPDEKYYDKYLNENTNLISHALGETTGWYDDLSNMISSTYPWGVRSGAYYDSSHTGMFGFIGADSTGFINSTVSFRLVLVNS